MGAPWHQQHQQQQRRAAGSHARPHEAASGGCAKDHEHGPGCGHGKAAPQQHDDDRGDSTAAAAAAAAARDASFAAQEAACWSCEGRHKRGSVLCQSCDKIQPLDSSLTYFDIMGV